MLKKLLFLILLTHTVYAEGLGIYTLNVLDEYSYEEDGPNYGYSPGIGISFDTNLGKDKVFAYRLNFEYYKAKGTDYYRPFDAIDGVKRKYDIEKRVFSVVNIIAFGLYRSEHVRLWIGPVIGIHSENNNKKSDYYDYDYYLDLNVDVGPAIGINYNINEDMGLALDLTYGIFSTGLSSAKARGYLFWRFGESFEKHRAVQPIQQRHKPPVHVKREKTFEEKLEYLKSLRDQEILTEEEYQLKRKELVKALEL